MDGDNYHGTMHQHFSDLGKLLIRLAAGGLMLFHGVSDIMNGPGEVMKTFAAQGLPTFLAYGIYLGEFVAPLLILLGVLARPAGVLVAGTMMVAVATAHGAQIFSIDDYGAWQIEVNAFYFLTALAVTCLGSGRWSVSRGRFPWD